MPQTTLMNYSAVFNIAEQPLICLSNMDEFDSTISTSAASEPFSMRYSNVTKKEVQELHRT